MESIMSQLDDIDEQQWHARIARKRLDLSTSVEETLAENSFQEDEWLDELDGGGEINNSKHESQFDIQTGMGSKKNLALIPPRLSLQSRSLPVVHAGTPVQSHESSSHLAVRTPRSEPRLAGRSTKVRLKAIPRTEELKQAYGNRQQMLSGSRTFKRGQGEIAVENTHVTPSSVITTMLTGDPGPVVVQYISLRPGVGFTVHLSAPAEKETSFNYVVMPGEPC
jgi:hypothetical protein